MLLRRVLRSISIPLIVLLFVPIVHAQGITRQAFKDSVQNLPYFSIHKDNYFISGTPTNTSINSNTANAKYQISFKQMITRSALPFDTYLFVTYSQKAFWDVYKESYPFREINFNPTIGVGKAIFDKNDRLKGVGSVYFEHESNGRDSIFSRSWNRLSLEYTTEFGDRLRARGKVWLPFSYKEGNSDILDYRGLGELQLSYEVKPDKLYIEVLLRKGLTWDTKGAFRPRIYFNPFRRNIANQYLMMEWYVGQAESLMDYKPFTSMVRIGYVIKSNELSLLKGK
ncbi:phospholipase A [Pricia sp. S334]|uniref:Phosphatidylcholine 1-acylhydrolase n=1 Tax=Pricia mediterranea TaxID=3076079 RepID=A0ABU3L904_9FLAO|nr:phospholipase A [Pricia sp. S334]MDT7830231.1 phospholipase A [Pricia sp. S334]